VHKSGSGGFLKNSRLWRLRSGSKEAENMIKVAENGREGVCVDVDAEALGGSFQ